MDSMKPDGKLIRLSKSCIGDDEKKMVLSVLDSEYLGMGSTVGFFEGLLSEYFGRQVLCVNNGTAALQLALEAVGVGRGDEVLVQSLTYVATYQAISATGAIPVSCEIDSNTMTISIEDAKKKLTKKTKAVVPVHYAGGVGNLNDIYKFSRENNLRIIEDAAHAFGTVYQNSKIGSQGDVVCFSFDGIKNFTSGEGGCIVTDDRKVLSVVSDARLLGVKRDSEQRYQNQRSWEFDVDRQGWRYHMSNVMAAIGIAQFRRFSQLSKKRQTLAIHYDRLLENNSSISLHPSNYSEVVPHIYPIKIRNKKNRDELREDLLKNGIQTGVHYYPNHLLSYYRPHDNFCLPVTESIYGKLMSLPLHPDLSLLDVELVCENLLRLLKIKS